MLNGWNAKTLKISESAKQQERNTFFERIICCFFLSFFFDYKPHRMLASSSVDRGFEPRSNKTKDYKISIWYFSALARRTKE